MKRGDLVRLTEDMDWNPSPEPPYVPIRHDEWPEGTTFLVVTHVEDGEYDGEYGEEEGFTVLKALLNDQHIEFYESDFPDSLEVMT